MHIAPVKNLQWAELQNELQDENEFQLGIEGQLLRSPVKQSLKLKNHLQQLV